MALGVRELASGYTIAGCPLGLWARWSARPDIPSIILVFKNDGLPMIIFEYKLVDILKTAIQLRMV